MSDVTEEVKAQPEPESRRPAQQPRSSGLSPWLAPAALLIALVAVGLAAWALTSALSTAKSTATAQLPGDPKMRVCTAFDTVTKAVTLQTHNDLGNDPVAQNAVAGNARLALLGGGQYLMGRLDSATPSQLADAVRSFAQDLEDIGVNALAGVPNRDPAQAARLSQGDLGRQQIVNLCK